MEFPAGATNAVHIHRVVMGDAVAMAESYLREHAARDRRALLVITDNDSCRGARTRTDDRAHSRRLYRESTAELDRVPES